MSSLSGEQECAVSQAEGELRLIITDKCFLVGCLGCKRCSLILLGLIDIFSFIFAIAEASTGQKESEQGE